MAKPVVLVGELLAKILERTEFPYFVLRLAPYVEIVVDEASLLLVWDVLEGEPLLAMKSPGDPVEVSVRVEMTRANLIKAIRTRGEVKGLVVEPGVPGKRLPNTIKCLAERCFAVPPFDCTDRDELVYPALFGTTTRQQVWESPTGSIRVFCYPIAGEGKVHCVSSGLSNCLMQYGTGSGKDPVGYELIAILDSIESVQEFCSWVSYLVQGGSDILPDERLICRSGQTIPGTEYAGFLVTRPHTVLPCFPVGSRLASWHYLVPATQAELRAAEHEGTEKIVRSLPRYWDNGF